MEKEEFSKLLKEARKMSGVTSVEMVTRMQKTESTINDLMRCRTDNSMSKIINYLDAISFQIVISNQQEYIFDDYAKLQDFVTRQLKDAKTMEISESLDITRQTLLNIKKGGPIRLSVFLKLINLNHYTLRLDAKI